MAAELPTDEDRAQVRPETLAKMERFAAHYAQKSGTVLNPTPGVAEFVIIGLARHVKAYGRPLCPCNFYEDKAQEVRSSSFWICPCEEMQRFKYCHCLLFVTESGLPITEHLPADHEGREIYGLVQDPTPGQGRALGRLEAARGVQLHKDGARPEGAEAGQGAEAPSQPERR